MQEQGPSDDLLYSRAEISAATRIHVFNVSAAIMNNSVYVILDKFFFIFHTSLVFFILFGWIWKKARRINLVVQLLTLFSWFVLGIWYGFGYCPCTDLHWQVRAQLGYHDMPASYLVFLIKSFTGSNVDKTLVDVFAVIFVMSALIASFYANFKRQFTGEN